MNSKQRVLNALNGLNIDRIPIDMFEGGSIYPALTRMRLMEHFKTSAWDDVLVGVKSDLRWLDAAVYKGPKRYTPEGKEANEFGAVELAYSPLKGDIGMEHIEAYDWPDADDWDYTGLREQALKYPDYAICAPYIPTMLFCRAAELMSMQDALICMYTEPDIFEAMIDRIFEYSYRFLENTLKSCGDLIDILWTWDDVAMQTGMIFPKEKWRKFFKNRMRKICDLAKKHHVKMMYHCCGSLIEIIPDLIEIGVDILSPVQTTSTGMDPEMLKKEFGRDLCFHGGIDTQWLLPYGTEGEVREAVRRNIEAFGDRYILGSSHVLNDCIPVRNVIAMFDEAVNFKL